MVFLYRLVSVAFDLYSTAIIVRIILSWIPVSGALQKLTNYLGEITDPYLAVFRRLLPPRPGFPLDFSPILALIALQIISHIVLTLLSLFIF